MKFSSWTLAGFVAIALPAVALAKPASTQSQPLQIAQDVRPAIASIDPTQPIQITLVNSRQSSTPFAAYLVQPPSGERLVPPGQTVIFGRLHTSYVPLPINLTAYVQDALVKLDFDVSVRGNEIILTGATVPCAASGCGPDNAPTRSLEVDAQGDIYYY